jgi:hypothetical protein
MSELEKALKGAIKETMRNELQEFLYGGAGQEMVKKAIEAKVERIIDGDVSQIIMNGVDNYFGSHSFRQRVDDIVKETIGVSDMANAGGGWTEREDEILRAEVDAMIQFLSKQHRRSVGAIKARIKRQELIFPG